MGRKATDPIGIAGLPKEKEFSRPVVFTPTRAFFIVPVVEGLKGIKAMQIKIYRYFPGKIIEIAAGLVDLDYPPKVTECRAVIEKEKRMFEEVRQYIELTLKNDLIPGHLGLEGMLEYYRPPVKKPLIQINGVDYAWTIEETPSEVAQEEIKEASKVNRSTKQDERAEKKKILIVEDDPDFAKALEIRLKDNGYEVVTAFDALIGVSLVYKQKPDVIILDIFMPGGWGFTVAQKLKHSNSAWLKSIGLIFVTGSQDERHEKMAMRLGARFYFHKPIAHQVLLDAVKSTLGNNG